MSRREKREWKGFWGNSGLTENQLIDKVILILVNKGNTISYQELFEELFENARGQILDYRLHRILRQLDSDGIIETELTSGGVLQPPTTLICITGFGIKMVKEVPKPFHKKPYTYHRYKTGFDSLFVRYLPIIISIIALIVAVQTCNRTK